MTFEDKIKESLNNVEPKYNEEAWNNIENAVLKNNKRFQNEKIKKYLFVGGAIAAATIATLFFIIPQEEKSTLSENTPKNVEKVEQTQASTDLTDTKSTSGEPIQSSSQQVNKVTKPEEPIHSLIIAEETSPSIESIQETREISPMIVLPVNQVCVNEPIEIQIHKYENAELIFGDQKLPAKRIMKLSFDKPGDYEVKLVSSIEGENQEYFASKVTVYDSPDRNFEVVKSRDIKNPEVKFVSRREMNSTKWYVDNEFVGSQNELAYFFNTRGQYNIKLVSESPNGCVDSSTQSIRILRAYNLMASSVFNPEVETWIPLGLQKEGVNFDLMILNSEGQVVYRTKDPSKGWNGHIDGKRVENGEMFLWLAKVYGPNNSVREYGNSFLVNSLSE